jgi:UDP-N-acetyl-D-glucosamine dehydrogenase
MRRRGRRRRCLGRRTRVPDRAERLEQARYDVANGPTILTAGASYEGGVGDIRESPALRIIEVLQGRGGIVSYHDDYVPSLSTFGLETLDDAVAEADAVVLVPAHPEIDHAAIAARSALFVDLRGMTRGVHTGNLVRL